MIETESNQLYLQKLCGEFNKVSKGWKAKLCGFLNKNMSIYCETIEIKEKKFFGRKIRIDYWEKGGFFMIYVGREENYDWMKDIIKLFEEISKEEVEIERRDY